MSLRLKVIFYGFLHFVVLTSIKGLVLRLHTRGHNSVKGVQLQQAILAENGRGGGGGGGVGGVFGIGYLSVYQIDCVSRD